MAPGLTWRRWLARSLQWRWRQHCASAIAVAIAVAVLAGAMVVGWSLQKSLRERLLSRLGEIGYVISPAGGVTPDLADRVAKRLGTDVGQAFYASGVASTDSGLSVPGMVWGVTDADRPAGWRIPADFATDEVIINDALARDLQVAADDWIVVRIDTSSARPAAGLFTFREASDLARNIRVRVREIAPAGSWADFSQVQTQQGARNLFVRADALGTGLRINRLLFAAGRDREGAWPSPAKGEGSGFADSRQTDEGVGPTGVAAKDGHTWREAIRSAVNDSVTLDDVGLARREGYLHSRNIVFPRAQLEQAITASLGVPVSTHIAEEIVSGKGAVSYGVIAATEGNTTLRDDQVVLNQWVADDLHVAVGERITLVALVAGRDGGYARKEIALTVAEVKPVGEGLFNAAVTPELEGMTTASRMDRWKTPFPVDMRKVTDRDEKYWEQYRAAPKAEVSWKLMQRLWRDSGFGGSAAVTGIRLAPDARIDGFSATRPWIQIHGCDQRDDVAGVKRSSDARSDNLASEIGVSDPTWEVVDLRQQMESAGRGSSDFASLFGAMSAFLIVAAVAIAAGVISTGIESRMGEMGLASAVGIAGRTWRLLMLAEQLVVCVPGIVIGIIGGVAYARALMWLFARLGRGVWEIPPLVSDARPMSLVVAGVGVTMAILVVTRMQVRRLLRRNTRELLSGLAEITTETQRHRDSTEKTGRHSLFATIRWNLPDLRGFRERRISRPRSTAHDATTQRKPKNWHSLRRCVVSAVLRTGERHSLAAASPRWASSVLFVMFAVVAVFAAGFAAISPIAGFFVGATCVLIGGWFAMRGVLSPRIAGGMRMTLWSLCVQFMRSERRRVMLVFGLFAAASFVVCAVAVFRGATGVVDPWDVHGASGGLALRISSPVAYRSDLGTPRGRERMALPVALPEGVRIYSLLSSGGTEGGCLNLAVPGEMQVLGVGDAWIDRGGFEVITQRPSPEPWRLLTVPAQGGSIPVFGDEETMQWIAHRGLGDEFEMPIAGRPVKLRLAGLVRGGLFSGQLLMHADALRPIMASEPGYQTHFVELPRGSETQVKRLLAPLKEYGFAVEETTRIVASVRSVQELYMTLFVVLGGLGLLLGIGGSVIALVRDALMRRGELALLQAVGLGRGQATASLLLTHLIPLAAGVVAGAGAGIVGYLAFGRPVDLLIPMLLCLSIMVVASSILAAIARAMQPTESAGAMRAG